MNMSVTSKMPTNCGMKNMNHSSSANSVQATNTSDVNPNLGTAIDVKA